MKEMPGVDRIAVEDWMTIEQDSRISAVIAHEQTRLRNFIRSRVPDRGDAEDILQEVFYELVEAYRR
jgi:DNA-directed RNA polymerase specialized sigma24 family protein